MTITLYLEERNLLEDTKTLHTIFQAGSANIVQGLSKLLKPIKIFTNSKDINCSFPVAIQVTLEEFALIGVFNGKI